MTNKLKEIREEKGIGISELARKAGVARQTIYNIEADPNRTIDSNTMEALAKGLDVKVSRIFLF